MPDIMLSTVIFIEISKISWGFLPLIYITYIMHPIAGTNAAVHICTEVVPKMRFVFFFVASTLFFVGCNHRHTTQTVTASTDADATLHPAELKLSGAVTVTCVSATGKNGSAGKCNINGASVAPPSNVTATDKVYLLCEGTPPSTCTAKVD